NALGGIPLTVEFADPILEDAELAARLDGAIGDLQRSADAGRQLRLLTSVATAEWYSMWASLMHPHKRDLARSRLSADMQMPSLAVRRPQLAFKYLDSYDPAPLNDYLKRREAVGGWDDNDLFAAVILKIHANDHTGLASLIETHRARVQELLTPPRTL